MASIIKADTLQSTTSNVFVLNSAGTEYARFDSSGVFQLANPTTFPAGTAAAPSITATGDTNTGLYFPAADTIAFTEGGVESMRIDSAGNVGVGVTPSAWASNFKGVQLGRSAYTFGRSDADAFYFGVNNYWNGSNDKYIQTGFASYAVQGSGNHSMYSAASGTAGNNISFTQVFAVGKGTSLALEGASSQTGVGITFPATQSASSNANTLDDYEEGTFTPTAIGGSSAGTTTYTGSPVGTYTKIGRQVTAKGGLTYSAMTGTGELVLNLPFTSDAEYIGSVMTNGMNWPAGALSMTLYTVTSTATARVFFSGDDNAWQVQQCVNESTSIIFTVTYFTS
jgi:hypothetical protein